MITEISGQQLSDLRFELRHLDNDLNSLFRCINDNKTVEIVRYLDEAKEKVEKLLNKIGRYE